MNFKMYESHRILKIILTMNFLLLLSAFFLTGCRKPLSQKGNPAYIAQIKEWHEERIENLKKPNGWLNLVGLYWLKDGENTFGSDSANSIIFPDKAPKYMGVFRLNNGKATVKINTGLNVTNNGSPVTEMELQNDLSASPTILEYNSLRWFIIKRGDNMYGVRLRDLDAPLVKNFEDIKTFPVNEDWRIMAEFVKYNAPKVISVPSIIGTVDQDTLPGYLSFVLNGKKYKLDPVVEGNEFFIIFADETNGKETYGAGRFLYAAMPESAGKTILDFNKAYNPPCAFTEFATCPLPPKDNYLHLKITAGEKKYGEE